MKTTTRVGRIALFASSGLASLACATPALADCAPDPAPLIGPVICTGVDADGIVLTRSGSVIVEDTADVASVRVTAAPTPFPGYPEPNISTLNVAGSVHGVEVMGGQISPVFFVVPRSHLGVTVQQGGVIDGNGVRLVANPLTPFPGVFATASVDNSGLIAADSGASLLGANPDSTGFTTITNRETGTIRGIFGNFEQITNQGTITDNGFSAIVFAGRNSVGFHPSSRIYNEGTISSVHDGYSTINVGLSFFSSQFGIFNSGSILNSGTGAAIFSRSLSQGFGPNFIEIVNSGTIASGGIGIDSSVTLIVTNTGTITGGATAIHTESTLALRNYGTINGTVRADGPPQGLPFIVSSILLGRSSRINGDLILGPGNDILKVEHGGGPIGDRVSGTIDGGAGNNTLRYVFTEGLTEVTSPFDLLAGFEFTGIELEAGAEVQLRNGFALGSTLNVTPAGANFDSRPSRLFNFADLASSDTAFVIEPRSNIYGSTVDFYNIGSITANLPQGDRYALMINDGFSINYGSIVANGGGGVWTAPSISFVNFGSISASGTGATVTGLHNSGTIASSGGVGVVAGNGIYNDGAISGQLAGAQITGGLVNAGTISSNGTGVLVRDSATIINEASGTIGGGVAAIGFDPTSTNPYVIYVRNAGTINGDVNVASGGFYSIYNSYEAVGSGTLNGNLYLGDGRLLVEYGRSGPLGGITGSIFTTAGATLQYDVRQDLTLAFPARSVASTFTNVVWNLNGYRLTLTGPVPSDPFLQIEGGGSVDIRTNLDSDSLRTLLEGNGTVTNYGTLTVTHANAALDPVASGAIAVSGFVNEGTIVVKDLAPAASGILARGMGVPGVNNGQILVSGAIGAVNASGGGVFENYGTIGQLKGGAAGIGLINYQYAVNRGTISTALIGVLNVGSLLNSGTIVSDGTALQMGSLTGEGAGFGGGFVENYGLIQGTKGPAVRGLSPAGDYAVLINYAEGTIRGKPGGAAIVIDGTANIQNYGLIEGNVVLGTTGPYYTGSAFYAFGGSLKGDLTFGATDDNFYFSGGTITGTVDGGSGFDSLQLAHHPLLSAGFDLRRIRNFESFELFGEGTFTLANAPQFDYFYLGGGMKAIVPSTQTFTATNRANVSGWLQVDGTLITDRLEITYNSVLSGTGIVNANGVTVQSGFVVPGGDGTIGRLTVRGDLGFDNGGALMIDVGTGDNDRLVVKSDADSIGALYLNNPYSFFPTDLNLRAVGTGPRYGKTYTIATADGGISGQFNSVQGSFGVLVPQLTYGPTAITLTFDATSLAAQLPQSATRVELAFAQALDSLRGSNFAELSSLYGTVDLLDPGNLGLALGALNPTIAGEASGFARQQGTRMFDLVAGRMTMLGSGQVSFGRIDTLGQAGNLAALAQAPAGAQLAASQTSLTRSLGGGTLPGIALPDGMSGFVSGGFDHRRGSVAGFASPDSARRSWHMTMGLEIPVAENAFMGTAVAHSEGLSGRNGMQAGVSSSQFAAYGVWQVAPRAYLGAVASFGLDLVGMERRTWVDSSGLTLSGRGTSVNFATQIEGGYRLPLGDWGSLTPHAALRYSGFGIDRLTERGGQAALRLDNIGDNRLDLRLGLRFDAAAAIDGGWQLAPMAEAELVRTVTGGHGTMTVQFSAAEGAGFTLPFGLDAGTSFRAKGGVSLRNAQTSLTLAVSSEDDWAGERENRAAVELQIGF